jgi:methyl-accepting chemotaxis protein
MKFLDRFTVGGKLAFAFCCVMVLMVLLGTFAVVQLSRVHQETDRIATVRLPGVRDSLLMSEAATRLRVREFRLIVSKPEEIANALDRMEAGHKAFDEARKSYEEAIADDTERKLFDKAMADWKQYKELGVQLVATMKTGQVDEGRTLVLKEGLKRFDVANASLKELAKYNDTRAQEDTQASARMYATSRLWVIGVLVLSMAVAVALGVAITRAIARPLRSAVDLAEAVAGGDLTRHADAAGKDEVAQLTRALGRMVAQLRTVVSEVRSGVESVSTASAEISTGNHDLSQRTEEQASNLQQTAASMEQISATVKHNADNALHATRLAASASEVAAKGGEVVGQVVTTMHDITQSSNKIADIIGVIDGIAFQTNILALNAAVEAARAGEQGRGFAVVASEVRSLAQRSAQAAKEIKSLIGDSVQKVDDGARLVADAGETMRDIVAQVKRVADLIDEISSSSNEQSTGINQVGDAVAQLDQVTQQNAALVEESAAAAESLKYQAQRLAEVVSVFRVAAA